MRDMRNPYGSEGGYVTNRRPRRNRGDRGMRYNDMPRGRERDYGDNMDGHYPHRQGSTYYPIEAMGTFNGYYGMPEQEYDRAGRDYRGNRGGRDYGDYGYDYGDYGETLSEQELEHWNKKLMEHLDDREKQIFHKDTIMQKARAMNKQMEGFSEKELYTTTLMCYTDYKTTIGQNPDLAMKLAYDWLTDKDVAVKGAEKLAIYYDCIVQGE